MKAARYQDEDAMVEKGVRALIDALGSIEAVRFMTLPRARRIESVKRHREWQSTLNKDEFFGDVFSHSKEPSATNPACGDGNTHHAPDNP